MKSYRFAPLLALALACGTSGSSDPAAAPGPDAGPAADAAPQIDPYEEAVLAATWTKLSSAPKAPSGAKMDDIFFASPKVAYIANGPAFGISKSTDGGDTWNGVFSHSGTYFRSVAFLDEQHGFAGNLGAGLTPAISDDNVLYETKDGGTTWNPVTAISGPKPSGICNLTVIDAQHVVAVGRTNGPSFVLASRDGGASWTSVDVSSKLSMLIDAHFSSPDEGLVVGMGTASSTCTILRTTDGGKSFDQVFASTTQGSLCWKVHFPTPKVGYVAVQDTSVGPATFAKTVDGGKTWTEAPLPVQGNAKDGYATIGIGFITEKIGWVVSEDAKLPAYRTKDGGDTWEVEPSLKAPINRFRFVDKNTAFAIGGAVWKLTVDTQSR